MTSVRIFLDTFYLYPGLLYKLQLSNDIYSSLFISYKNLRSFILAQRIDGIENLLIERFFFRILQKQFQTYFIHLK